MPSVKEKTQVVEQEAAPRKSPLPANIATLLTRVAVFGLIGLVAVFAAFLLTTKVLKPMLAHKTPATQQQAPAPPKREEVPVEAKSEAVTEKGKAGAHEKAEAKYYTIESIVVNPAGTGGTRFLSCSVSFETETESDLKAFESKDVQIKDILITILSSKTVEELSDIRLRNKMRQQILTVVNRFVAPAKAKAVYLTDFVLQ